MNTVLADRYGTAPKWRRPVLVVISVLVALTFLTWLGWTVWFHSTPAVSSDLKGYQVVGVHQATATVAVDLAEDAADANCRVRALAEDHSIVGEASFEPTDGDNEVTIRTEREATSVELIGCTAEGQARAK